MNVSIYYLDRLVSIKIVMLIRPSLKSYKSIVSFSYWGNGTHWDKCWGIA